MGLIPDNTITGERKNMARWRVFSSFSCSSSSCVLGEVTSHQAADGTTFLPALITLYIPASSITNPRIFHFNWWFIDVPVPQRLSFSNELEDKGTQNYIELDETNTRKKNLVHFKAFCLLFMSINKTGSQKDTNHSKLQSDNPLI